MRGTVEAHSDTRTGDGAEEQVALVADIGAEVVGVVGADGGLMLFCWTGTVGALPSSESP